MSAVPPILRRTPSERIKSFFRSKKNKRNKSTDTNTSSANSETDSVSQSHEISTSLSRETADPPSQNSRDNSALRKVSSQSLNDSTDPSDPKLKAALAMLREDYEEDERSNEEVMKLGSALQKELKDLRSEVRRD